MLIMMSEIETCDAELSIEDVEMDEEVFPGENIIYTTYMHQNKTNNKIYVGYSKRVEFRWEQEERLAFKENYSGYNYPLYRAIRRVGWDGFTHHIIETFNNKQDALDAEMFWIEYFRTYRKKYGPDCGYNLTKGGENLPSQKGAKRSQATKDRMSAALKGRKSPMEGKIATDDHRIAISEGSIGKDGTNTGKIVSQETKDRMSKASKGKQNPEAHKFDLEKEKEIVDYYLNNISTNIRKMSKIFDCKTGVIGNILKRFNISIRNSDKGIQKLFDKDYNTICEMSDLGFSKEALARFYEISAGPIRYALRRRKLLLKAANMTIGERNNILLAFDGGLYSTTKLANKFGLLGETIRKILLEENRDVFKALKGNPRRVDCKSKLTKEDEEMILDCFINKTDSIRGMARKTVSKVSMNTVRKFLKKNGFLGKKVSGGEINDNEIIKGNN